MHPTTPLHSLSAGGGGLSLVPNFQKGRRDLTVSQFLEGDYWEIVGNLFQGGCGFYIKIKENLKI